jgi:L-aminopeptidase/D-esterase-like protein
MRPGPLNLITDVPGLLVGHATDECAITGVTTAVAETHFVGGVDVRGGAPGVRETDTLAPEALVDQVHAIVLAGGSVFGLGAADGVATTLSNAGRGLRILSHTRTIPIVPAAVLHDLGGPATRTGKPRLTLHWAWPRSWLQSGNLSWGQSARVGRESRQSARRPWLCIDLLGDG